MARMTLSQLRDKDVINLCNATRLGYINEIEFDSCNGQICALVLCRNGGLLNFSKDGELLLPWSRIECIGEDAVLVKIPAEELAGLESECLTSKRSRNRGCK